MSAPFYAYTNSVLKAGNKKLNVAKLDTSYAVMKNRFYLDEFVNLGNKGVIGAVYEGGANASMHNLSTRRGAVRSGGLIWLNDAGLNTKGVALYVGIGSQMGAGIAVSLQSKSAYYLDTDDVSVKWKMDNDSVWQENFAPSGHSKNTTINTTILLNSAGTTLTPNQNMNIKVCNYNAEGVKESSVITMQVPAPQGFFAFDANYGSYAYATWQSGFPPAGSYYFNSWEFTSGTIVYTDQNLNITTGAGYYANDTTWFKTNASGEIIAIGSIGNWDAGDPATPERFVQITYAGSESNWIRGCNNPSFWNPITIWYDNVDNVARQSNNQSSALVNGFFYTGGQAFNGSWEFVYYYNGVTDTYTYNCLDGFVVQP